VRCLNYDCGKELVALEEVGQHFVTCGIKITCAHCGFMGYNSEEIDEHICEIKVYFVVEY